MTQTFLQWMACVYIFGYCSAVDLYWRRGQVYGETNSIFEQNITFTENDAMHIKNSSVLKFVCFATPFKTHTVPIKIFEIVPELSSLTLFKVELNILNGNDYKNAKFLKSLSINRNNIPILKAHSFSSGKIIEYIDLSRNKIRIIETDAFEGLNELKILYLDSNKIVSLDLKYFIKFPKLIELDLSNTTFQFSTTYNNYEINKNIAYNSPLTELNLADNMIDRSDVWRCLSIFPNLRQVDLSFNYITHFDNLEEIDQLLPNLWSINAKRNSFNSRRLKEAEEYFKKKHRFES